MSLNKAWLVTLALALFAATPASAATFLSSDGIGGVFDPVEGKTLFAPPVSRSAEPADRGTFAFVTVPEPATWAMMFVGFGSIGLTIRSRSRRRAKLVSA